MQVVGTGGLDERFTRTVDTVDGTVGAVVVQSSLFDDRDDGAPVPMPTDPSAGLDGGIADDE